MLSIMAHVGEDGVLHLTLDQFKNSDVELIVRPLLKPTKDQWGILDIPPLELDPRHDAFQILSREDMYDDDGR